MSVVAATTTRAADTLAQSYAFCTQLTRAQARNFYYGLKLLPEPKRSAMFVLYAYMRLVDDIADGDDSRSLRQRGDALDAWSESTHAVLSGQPPTDGGAIWPAFADMIQRYGVPGHVFQEVIAGQRQDLAAPAYQTFEDLRQYCYRVAGVVGLASIHIWGFQGGAQTESLAIDRGVAFQLTNILRDLREDAGRGRCYLPLSELAAAGCTPADISAGRLPPGFGKFLADQIIRAQSYYQKSAPLDDLISADSRPTLAAMTQIYRGLLAKMAADPLRVMHQRVSLSALAKVRIAWRAARSR
jgi:phytoene synthase